MSKKEVYICDLCNREFQLSEKLNYGIIDELIKPSSEANGSREIMLADVEDNVNSEDHLHICIHCRITLFHSIFDDLSMTQGIRRLVLEALEEYKKKVILSLSNDASRG